MLGSHLLCRIWELVFSLPFILNAFLKILKYNTWIFSSLKNLLVSTLENKKWMLVVVLVAAVVIPSWFCGCVGCCHE